MSKKNIFSGFLLALAMILASCESYNMQPGHVDGGSGKTESGQVPGGTDKQKPGQDNEAERNPDVVFHQNSNLIPAHPPEVTGTYVPPSRTPQPLGKVDITGWYVYVDSTYYYQINYPPQLATSLLETVDLVKIKPQAAAGVSFNDPARNLAGMALAIFSIRIYKIGTSTPVESWLETHGLYLPDSGWTIEKYQGKHFSGWLVQSSTYMAPGQFYYATRGEYLYQLTPFGADAVAMLTTFEFTQ